MFWGILLCIANIVLAIANLLVGIKHNDSVSLLIGALNAIAACCLGVILYSKLGNTKNKS
jgi:hypothetical protein